MINGIPLPRLELPAFDFAALERALDRAVSAAWRPSRTPCEDVDPPCVGTYSGLLVPLEYPSRAMILLADIAHSLAGINRYTGHGDVHYSVAQHSVVLSRMVEAPALRRGLLLHDATEAYLGDVSSPLKRLLPEYRELEARWARAIAARFDVDLDDPEIKELDALICQAEMATNGPRGPWVVWREAHCAIDLTPWSAERAEREFLATAAELGVS